MMIHNGISLPELQMLLRDNNLSITHCGFVASAGCWKVTLSKEGFWSQCSGLGRDIGEALKNAFNKFSEVTT